MEIATEFSIFGGVLFTIGWRQGGELSVLCCNSVSGTFDLSEWESRPYSFVMAHQHNTIRLYSAIQFVGEENIGLIINIIYHNKNKII